MVMRGLLNSRLNPNNTVHDRIFRVESQVNELGTIHSHDFRIFVGRSLKPSRLGAEGGTRTLTPSLAPDFESGASTSSTTPAGRKAP